MTDGPDQALSERFALQHDELPKPDFADVLRRASRITIRPEPRKQPRNYRLWGARPVLAAAVVVGVLAGAGVGVAAAVGAFEGTPAPPDVSTTSSDQSVADAVQKGIALTFPQTTRAKPTVWSRSRRLTAPKTYGLHRTTRAASALSSTGRTTRLERTEQVRIRWLRQSPPPLRTSASATCGSTPTLMS